jgi:voltage-gated potassium channel
MADTDRSGHYSDLPEDDGSTERVEGGMVGMTQGTAPDVESSATLRRQAFRQLYGPAWPHPGLSPLNRLIAGLIAFSVALIVIESEPTIYSVVPAAFDVADAIIAAVFLAEYGARLWVAPEIPRYRGATGRLRYALSAAAVIDLVAFLPYFLFAGSSNSFLIRILRLLRLLALAKFGRFSMALRHIHDALSERRFELLATLVFAGSILLISATLMYLIEGQNQPEKLGSIPRAMWWSISTLTTVGYGDVYPETPLGKVLAGITALAAIGVFALPTGVLAAAFADAFCRHAAALRQRGAGVEGKRAGEDGLK